MLFLQYAWKAYSQHLTAQQEPRHTTVLRNGSGSQPIIKHADGYGESDVKQVPNTGLSTNSILVTSIVRYVVGGVHGLDGVLGAPVLVCTVAIVSVTSSRGEKDIAIIPDQKMVDHVMVPEHRLLQGHACVKLMVTGVRGVLGSRPAHVQVRVEED